MGYIRALLSITQDIAASWCRAFQSRICPDIFLCDGTAIGRIGLFKFTRSDHDHADGYNNQYNEHHKRVDGYVRICTSECRSKVQIYRYQQRLQLSSMQIILLSRTRATGSGSGTLVFFPWGNGDNATTFNLPDLRRKTTAGKFGIGSTTLGNKVGQSGGAETTTLLETNLPSTDISANINTTRIANIVQGVSSADADLLVASPSGTPRATTIAFPNGGTAFNVVQPTAIVNKAIKY